MSIDTQLGPTLNSFEVFLHPSSKHDHTLGMVVVANEIHSGTLVVKCSLMPCGLIESMRGIDLSGGCENSTTAMLGWKKMKFATEKVDQYDSRNFQLRLEDDILKLGGDQRVKKVIVRMFQFPLFFNCFSSKCIKKKIKYKICKCKVLYLSLSDLKVEC